MPTLKRPVARHACLACREKKIKCDGELPPQPGELPTEVRRQRCSNCRSLGIECVFVRSQRGGRRKRDDITGSFTSSGPPSVSHELRSPSSSNERGSTVSSWLQSPLVSRKSDGDPAQVLVEKVHKLQREAANLHSQLLDRSDSSHMSASEHGYTPYSSYCQGYDRGPPVQAQWDQQVQHQHQQVPHQHPHQHHQPHHQPCPPPPLAPMHLYQMYAPPNHDPHAHHLCPGPMSLDGRPLQQLQPPPHQHQHQHQHQYQPQQQQQQQQQQQHPQQQHPHAQDSNPRKRSLMNDYEISLPAISRPQLRFISFPDEELERYDLPDWRTTCTLIDLYYRYIHPSRPFLPPKHRLIYQLQIRHDASLLHAMFSSSCRFASSVTIPSSNLRDPQHWYFLAEKYWDLMDLEMSLQALVLLMGALGPGGYVQQSIEGSARTYSLLKVTKTIEAHTIKDWKQFAGIITKRQAMKHEDMLRTIWSSWKLNVFIRMNRGSPFNKLSTNLLDFPSELPLPLSDSLFNSNMFVFDTNDNHSLLELKYRTWIELEMDLNTAAAAAGGPHSPDFKSFSDSDLSIIAVKIVEDMMDTISTGACSSLAVKRFSAKIGNVERIINSSLYHISHIKKKMEVVNISKVFALFLCSVGKIVVNVTQCHSLLLIKPHETHSNANPDDVFNSLYKSKLEDIRKACLSVSSEQMEHFVATFLAAQDVIRLLELGMGKIPEAAGSTIPIQVIGGPVNFTPASEIQGLKTMDNWWINDIPEPGKNMSAQIETYNEYPDIWIQYPIFSVVIVATALTVLASSVVLAKMMTFREVDSTGLAPGLKRVEWEIGVLESKHVVSMVMDTATVELLKSRFDVNELHQNVMLCSKYIHIHGRFWPYVESVSYQVEAIMNYIDDIVSKTESVLS